MFTGLRIAGRSGTSGWLSDAAELSVEKKASPDRLAGACSQ